MAGLDTYTKLLLHCDGNFTDSSAGAYTVTNSGATFATGKSGFGQCAVITPTSYFRIDSASADFDWGTGDWTIDFLIKFNSLNGGFAGSLGIISGFTGGVNGPQFLYRIAESGTAYSLEVWPSDSSPRFNSSTWTPTLGQWYHIAFVRSGNTLYYFVDGVGKGTSDITGESFGSPYDKLIFGAGAMDESGNPAYQRLDASMDEIRFSKGVARWTSSFTPPSEPYSEIGDVITGSFSFAKDTLQSYVLNIMALEALEPLASDSYFSDSANWKSVEFRYAHSSGEIKQLIFTNDGTGTFRDAVIRFSAKARTGSFPLASIVVTDFEDDIFTIRGASLPAGLDITLS